MATIYYEQDADFSFLKGKKIAVLGYGRQGHSQAQNLRDSKLDVIIAELEGSLPWKKAEADGFKVFNANQAASQADFMQILIQDHLQPSVYEKDIKPHLKPGSVLGFSHGFNIHFGQIRPPQDVDVIMVAPKAPGDLVREMYEQGHGFPALLAVEQDYSGNARQIGLAYAKGIGATRAGVIMTTFKEETETDLFGEQCALSGPVEALVNAAFETLVSAGYQPEAAYFEVCHEMKLIVDLMYKGGNNLVRESISDTARYGHMLVGPRIIGEESRKEMAKVLWEIQSGDFARRWILENQAGRPNYRALNKMASEHPIEEVGARLRKMMPWLGESR